MCITVKFLREKIAALDDNTMVHIEIYEGGNRSILKGVNGVRVIGGNLYSSSNQFTMYDEILILQSEGRIHGISK